MSFKQAVGAVAPCKPRRRTLEIGRADASILELFDVKQKGFLTYEEFVEVCESLGVFLSSADFQKFWFKAIKSDLKDNEEFLSTEPDFGRDPEGAIKSEINSQFKTNDYGNVVTKITTKTYTLQDGSTYTKTKV